ncbi:E3 ubiquitin ligase BIG BROTHER-related [Linum perenne]
MDTNNPKQPTTPSSTNNNVDMALHVDHADHDDVSTSEEDEDWSDSDAYGNDYEYFDIEQEAEFDGFLEEGQGSNSDDYDDGMEEDEIDPDDMSYEELLALGDLIGKEKRGLSLEQISAAGCLRPRKLLELLLGDVDRCVICQVEYYGGGGGEDRDDEVSEIVGCGHPYHKECITSWLMVKKSCPICGYEVSPSSSTSVTLANADKKSSDNVDNYDGNCVGDGRDCNGGGSD